MNSLSWFLYLADVIGNVQGLGIAFVIFGGLATLFYLFSLGFAKSGDNDAKSVVEVIWFAPWVLVIGIALAVFTPSKQTIYLIAGSEAGEAVVTSETGKEILQDIQEVIQHQLGELKGTTKKSSDTP